jgi:hypothetical protein
VEVNIDPSPVARFRRTSAGRELIWNRANERRRSQSGEGVTSIRVVQNNVFWPAFEFTGITRVVGESGEMCEIDFPYRRRRR